MILFYIYLNHKQSYMIIKLKLQYMKSDDLQKWKWRKIVLKDSFPFLMKDSSIHYP